jgi:predicted metal-dependent hydrolase
MATIAINGISIDVCKKRIKNIYIRVKAPTGEVSISAPSGMSMADIRAFAAERLPWILKQQGKISAQPLPVERALASGETVRIWGRPYTLELVPIAQSNRVVLAETTLFLPVWEDGTVEDREALLREYYRILLRRAMPAVIARCEARMGLHAEEWRVKDMRTRWGTCNIAAKRIWLSLRLAEKAPECLECVATHELCHLLERKHNAAFKGHMDRYFPKWREVQGLLRGEGGDQSCE